MIEYQPAYKWYRCTECKKVYPAEIMKFFNDCEYKPKFRFCPNCGKGSDSNSSGKEL